MKDQAPLILSETQSRYGAVGRCVCVYVCLCVCLCVSVCVSVSLCSGGGAETELEERRGGK